MILRYCSGEEILKCDKVLFRGNPTEIELVAADSNSTDPVIRWHMEEHGGGVMVLDPGVSGRTFIAADEITTEEDLEFVERAPETAN
jgi:hypothetical protein